MSTPLTLATPAGALMTLSSSLLLAGALACCGATAAASAPAAQSEAELRTSNEALRTRVADLELELRAAKARVAELEQRLAQANARLAALGGGAVGSGSLPEPAEPPSTIDESVASASPRALLRALQGEYASAMQSAGGWATPRERTVYFRALEKWMLNANRQHRTPIQWLVRFDEIGSVAEKQHLLRVTAIDPGSGIELGEPFLVSTPMNVFRRLESGGSLQRGMLLDLRGTLVPEVRINENRETIGAFDRPRFIGPFAELGFSVSAQSMVPAGMAAPSGPSGPAGPSGPSGPAAPPARSPSGTPPATGN